MAGGADFIKTSTGKVSPAATPAGHAGDARGGPRLPRADRHVSRREAGRRHPHRQGGGQLPGDRARDRRARLAAPRPVPLRRLVAAQRRADAAPQAAHRPLPPAPTTSRSTDADGMPDRPRPRHPVVGLRARARGPRRSPTIRPQLRAVHRRRVRRAGRRHAVHDHQPGHRGGAGRGRRGRPGRRRPRRDAPPAGPSPGGRGLPGAERGKYLFRIARLLQERSRELAVLESHRQRQADQRDPRRRPAAGRRALLPLRGLGRQARRTPVRPRPAAARRGRPGHPVELPAAHAGVEDRPGPGLRQHRRAQAGRDDAADRARLRRDLPAGRPAAGRRQHRHRRGRDRPRAGRAPGRRQGRLHRLDRGGQADPAARWPAPARSSRSSSAARRPTSSSTTPPSTRRSRASSTASSSTRATSAAPARGCWCRSRVHDDVVARLKRRLRHAARSATRSTRTPTSAPSTRPSSWTASRELVAVGRGRGRRALAARVPRCPSGASGTRRPSSPACPRATASPARRSSGRCCRC